MRTWPALLLVGLATTACSAETYPPAAPAPTTAEGTACGMVDVPAHEGVDVQAVGLDCAAAAAVVRAAEGLGRAAYEVDGFTCTPSPAPDGDTFYDCLAAGGERVTFRYGTA